MLEVYSAERTELETSLNRGNKKQKIGGKNGRLLLKRLRANC